MRLAAEQWNLALAIAELISNDESKKRWLWDEKEEVSVLLSIVLRLPPAACTVEKFQNSRLGKHYIESRQPLRVNDSKCSYESQTWYSSVIQSQNTIATTVYRSHKQTHLEPESKCRIQAQSSTNDAYIVATSLLYNEPDPH